MDASTLLTSDNEISLLLPSRELRDFGRCSDDERLPEELVPGFKGIKLGKRADDSSRLTTSNAFFSVDVAAIKLANEPGKRMFALNFLVLLQY